MKKITKILSLTVVVASMMTPLALLANSSNSVFYAKQEVNEVGEDNDELIIESNNVDNDVVVDNQVIDVNSVTDNDVAVDDIISSDNCTAEDSGQTSTAWMGVASEFINFKVSKDYVSELEFGEVSILGVSSSTITSTYLKIPNYIVANSDGKKYKVVGINVSAFSNCTGLTSLDLSNAKSLTSISGFDGCTGLTTLTIPASVTSIDFGAFLNCTGLKSLDLSNATSLTTISASAFYGCTGLTTLTIPASVTFIGNSAFENCTGLTGTLTIPASVTYIDGSAFENCSSLTKLDLSNAKSLTTLGPHLFAFCTGLTGTLTIPASITAIDGGAFFNTGLQEFKFLSPTPPTTLGTNIFGTNVTKTLWVPNAQAKAAYDPLAVSKFGLLDSSYIKFPGIDPTSVDITGVDGPYTINLNETNKTIATAIADVQPSTATNKAVTWSLENAPTWLKIDVNGNITADDNLKNATPGKFIFKVKAVCQADSTVTNTTNDIELNVVYAPITSLVIQPITPVNITLGSAPATLTTCKATVSPSTADSSKIKWSIPNNKPTWLDINPTTGVISTNSSVVDKNLPASANYTVQVDSTDGTNKSANATLTINFTKPEPTGVTILNLNTTGYNANIGTKFEIQLDWEVTPDYAKTEVDWKLTGPAGMSIDTSGKITYSPTQILPETNFIVTCTSKTSAATTQLTSKITVTQPSPPSTDSFSWWWLLAAEAGALVLGSVISIIVIVKRKQELK